MRCDAPCRSPWGKYKNKNKNSTFELRGAELAVVAPRSPSSSPERYRPSPRYAARLRGRRRRNRRSVCVDHLGGFILVSSTHARVRSQFRETTRFSRQRKVLATYRKMRLLSTSQFTGLLVKIKTKTMASALLRYVQVKLPSRDETQTNRLS